MRSLVRPALIVAAAVAIAACSPPAQPSPKAAAPAEKAGAAAKGNVDNGKQLVQSQGCIACHTIPGVPGATGTVGPPLAGLAGRAGSRVPGTSAEQYLRQSLTDPDAYTVEGFQKGVMPKLPLNDQQVGDFVAFLLTLQ